MQGADTGCWALVSFRLSRRKIGVYCLNYLLIIIYTFESNNKSINFKSNNKLIHLKTYVSRPLLKTKVVVINLIFSAIGR